jgi:hypothetical protein
MLGASDAAACSYAPGNVFPTEADRLRWSEALVVATVRKALPGEFISEGAADEESVYSNFRVVLPEIRLVVGEALRGGLSVGDELQLREHTSMCGPFPALQEGKTYLLGLTKSRGEWVRSYAHEATSTSDTRAQAAVAFLSRGPSAPAPQGAAPEITRLLSEWRDQAEASPYFKTVPERIALAASPKKEVRQQMLRALSWEIDPWALDYIRGRARRMLLESSEEDGLVLHALGTIGTSADVPLAALLAHDLDRDHRIPGGSLDRTLERRDLDALATLISLASADDAPYLLSLLQGADEPMLQALSYWFVAHEERRALPTYRKFVDGAYHERWQFVSTLAILGDEQVLAWAAREIDTPLPPKDQEFEALFRLQFLFLPYYVIVQSPLPEADALVKKVFEAGGLGRKWVREAVEVRGELPERLAARRRALLGIDGPATHVWQARSPAMFPP